MTEGSHDSSSDSPFICTYCERRFTQKEHQKRHERAHTGSRPFPCTVCDRRFSRGDVLTRHIRRHKEAAQLRRPSGIANRIPSPSLRFWNGRADDQGSVASSSPILRNGGSNDSQNISQVMSEPRDPPLQQNVSSTLLWPDSEGFFQSLMSGDGMNWDHTLITQPVPIQENVASMGPYTATDGTRADGLAAVEDGQRAVQTTYSLLTNTLFNVTLHVELSDLTPRFLDSSLHMFFTKFIPILPIIHQPTFIYRDCSAHLLLNAIALGSLFLGTEDATVKGDVLWKLAHTAIATSWSEMIEHRRAYDACSGVELVLSALLSQTYAALSKNPELRMTSQTFYGLSMHWAQYCGLYDIGSSEVSMANLPSEQDPIERKMNAWRLWAARETKLRTLLGLCIIDGVVSQFSGNFVNTCSATKHLPLAAADHVFAADTADKWIRAMKVMRMSTPGGSSFREFYHSLASNGTQAGPVECVSGLLNIKILLEYLASLAVDFGRASGDFRVTTPKLEAIQALVFLRQQITQNQTLSAAEKAIGLLRWHAVCLDLVASTARGARRMCHYHGITQNIFGGRKRQETVPIDAERWIKRAHARKNLLHAMEIHRIASEVPLGIIHDTCLPGALFAAATTYSSFALPGISKVAVPTLVDWEMVLLHGISDSQENTASEASDTMNFLQDNVPAHSVGWITRNLVYELGAIRILLHSLSQHWGVTQEMEEVTKAWEARCGA